MHFFKSVFYFDDYFTYMWKVAKVATSYYLTCAGVRTTVFQFVSLQPFRTTHWNKKLNEINRLLFYQDGTFFASELKLHTILPPHCTSSRRVPTTCMRHPRCGVSVLQRTENWSYCFGSVFVGQKILFSWMTTLIRCTENCESSSITSFMTVVLPKLWIFNKHHSISWSTSAAGTHCFF